MCVVYWSSQLDDINNICVFIAYSDLTCLRVCDNFSIVLHSTCYRYLVWLSMQGRSEFYLCTLNLLQLYDLHYHNFVPIISSGTFDIDRNVFKCFVCSTIRVWAITWIERQFWTSILNVKAKLDARKFCFARRVCLTWNNLPFDGVNAGSLNSFKRKLANEHFITPNANVCRLLYSYLFFWARVGVLESINFFFSFRYVFLVIVTTVDTIKWLVNCSVCICFLGMW